MFKEYIKAALRNFKKNKIYFAINIIGLALGLGVSFIVLTYVLDELSYDKFNKNYNNIARVIVDLKSFNVRSTGTPLTLAERMKQNFPNVISAVRLVQKNKVIKINNKPVVIKNYTYADSNIFAVFDIPVVSGSINGLSAAEDWIVISEKLKTEIFGNKNAIGEVIPCPAGETARQLRVAAVMKDIPHNSTLQAGCFVPLNLYEKKIYAETNDTDLNFCGSWNSTGCLTYLLFKNESDKGMIEARLSDMAKEYYAQEAKFNFLIQPLGEIYFHSSEFLSYWMPRASLANIYIFSVIAFFIILMACVNYIILSTAISLKQLKEIGIRRLNGASRWDIVKQTLFQSIFTSLLALPVSILIVELLLSSFGMLVDKNMTSEYYHSYSYIACFIAIDLITGIISGGYVSIYLSRLSALEIIKKGVILRSKKYYVREAMICFQMIVFIALIYFSLTINEQIKYCLTSDPGFEKEGVVLLDVGGAKDKHGFQVFQDEIKKKSDVVSVSTAEEIPFTGGYARMLYQLGEEGCAKRITESMLVGYDFIKTMNLKLLSGRDFSPDFAADSLDAIIVNESAAKAIGGNVVGKMIGGKLKYRVIGVVNDFHTQTYKEEILPVILRLNVSSNFFQTILVKVNTAHLYETLEYMKTRWKSLYGTRLRYDFFDDLLKKRYEKEVKFNKLINYSMAVAIFISVLGLFGLSLFMAERKLKDTSIRKVFGASVIDIIKLMLSEYIKMAFIACIISFPVSYYIAGKWLGNFVYKANTGISLFLLTCGLTIIITISAVGIQCLKVARSKQISLLNSQ